MVEEVGQGCGGEDALAPRRQPPRVGRRNPGTRLPVQRAELHGELTEEELAVPLLKPLLQPFLASLLQDLFVPLFDGFEQHGSELLQVDQLRDVLFSFADEKDAPAPHDKARRRPPSSGPGIAATRSRLTMLRSSSLRP